jgi:DNA-binding transcriptional regulator YdaS (Cro superfamily)
MSSKPKTLKIQRLVAKRARSLSVSEANVRREIAAACKTSPDFVYQWCRDIRPIPAQFAIPLERFFGADVYPREEIAPDVFKEAA